MRAMLRLASTSRIETAFIAAFLALCGVAALSAWHAASSFSDFEARARQARYFANAVEGVRSAIGNLADAESQQRGYLLTGQHAYLAEFEMAVERLDRDFESLIRLDADDPVLDARVGGMRQLAEARLQILRSGIAHGHAGDAARVREVIHRGRPLAVELRQRFAEMHGEYAASLSSARSHASVLKSQFARSLLATAVVAALLLGVAASVAMVEIRKVKRLSERSLHASRHDGLTGLPNRAYLYESLARALAAARREGGRVGVMVMDLDGFKAVNDACGHVAGDAVLAEVAREIGARVREADFAARLGGDEFVIVLPGVADRSLLEAAARRFASIRVVHGTHVVTLSVGWALSGAQDDTPQSLLTAADRDMYAQKRSRQGDGGNSAVADRAA